MKHPLCGNCTRKGDACSFLALVPSTQLTSTSAAPVDAYYGAISAPSIECYTTIHSATDTCGIDGDCLNGHVSSDCHQNHISSPVVDRGPTSRFLHLGIPTPLHLQVQDARNDTQHPLPSTLQDLLYYYKHTTSVTIENGGEATTVWQSIVPEIALDHDFLAHCMLSVSSLHIAHFLGVRGQPKEMKHWNATAASEMNHALSGYRPGMRKVTSQNVAALFASSALTAVYLFRTSAIDLIDLEAEFRSCGGHAPEIASGMISCIVKTIWGLRGPLQVLSEGWSWLVQGSMLPVASRTWWPKTRKPANSCAHDEDERLQRIEDLWAQTDRQYDPHSNYLTQALNLLRETYALISQLLEIHASNTSRGTDILVDRGAMFSWVTRVPREYIQLVEAQDREALVILAHYAVLLTRTNMVWWLEGLGSNFVKAIAMALGAQHWRLIEWPIQISGTDVAFVAT